MLRKVAIIAIACLLSALSPVSPARPQTPDSQLRQVYQRTLETYPEALANARQQGDRLQEMQILQGAGLAHQYFGNFQKAIELYQQAFAIARDLQNWQVAESILSNLAKAYSQAGDDQGINFLDQQLQAARLPGGSRQAQKILLSQLSSAYGAIGDYKKKIELAEESLQIIREFQNREEEMTAIQTIAVSYQLMGEYERAAELYEQQLTLARDLKNAQRESNALISLGNLYRQMGDLSKAIATYQQEIQLAQQAGEPPREILALQQLALVYAEGSDREKTLQVLEKSLAIAQKTSDRFQEAFSLDSLSRAHFLLGNYSQAINLQQKSLVLYRAAKQEQGRAADWSEMRAMVNLGVAQFRAGQLNDAEKNLREAIAACDLLWQELLTYRNVFGERRDDLYLVHNAALSDIYPTLQQILVAQNLTDAALEASEAGRARAFATLIAANLRDESQEQLPREPLTIAQIKQIAAAQNSTLVQYAIAYDDILLSGLRFGKKQRQGTHLLIWVIKPTGEIAFRQVALTRPKQPNTDLKQLVASSREALGIRSRGLGVVSRSQSDEPKKQELQELYQQLIAPIADLLPSDPQERVTFIPQDELFFAPFAALADPSGKYLIEKHAILTAPSIRVLDLTKKLKQRQQGLAKDVLIVGNPTMPKVSFQVGKPAEQLPSLPGAEREAIAISSLFNTRPLTGSQATKLAVVQRLPQARIVHLATHGLLDNLVGLLRQTVQSAIALAPTERDSGLLTAREIASMKLAAELAVLSACDTGDGQLSSDGIIGLARAFIGAGVPSVIVSLWAVPDTPTADLMVEFYRNLQQNPDKARALRLAMLATMKQYPNPRDWGAFVLIGES